MLQDMDVKVEKKAKIFDYYRGYLIGAVPMASGDWKYPIYDVRCDRRKVTEVKTFPAAKEWIDEILEPK
jgi:hypothetical protein